MAWWQQLFNALWRDTTAVNPAPWFVEWFGGGDTIAGVPVTPESALRESPAVWICVRLRSEDVGKLPCFLYRRLPGNGGKQRAVDHPYFNLLRVAPNPRMTAFEFKQLMQMAVDLHGNAYAYKETDARGQVVALWPIDPRKVTVLITSDLRDLFYKISLPDNPYGETLPAEAVLHIRGPTLNGITGLSPVGYHRETVGLAIAAQRYGAALFGNSAQPHGAVKVPGVLQPAAAAALRADWEARHKGSENAKKLAIFDGGMDWVQTGMDNTDAQYLETRNFQNREIWRMFRVPAHKAGDLERSTNNNIEQQALEYVTDCLMTELVRWEQALNSSLLTEAEQRDLFFEFLPDALLRGDLQSRYTAYGMARQWGFLNVDEIRERENLNALPNRKGQIYLQPVNMIEAGQPLPAQTPPPSKQAAQSLLLLAHEMLRRAEADEVDEAVPLQWPPTRSNGHAHNEA